MAVTVIATASGTGVGISNPTATIDCTGANALVVFVSRSFSSATVVNGVTFNGDAMTADFQHPSLPPGIDVFTLANPDQTSGTVQVTLAAGADCGVACIALAGADTADVLRATDVTTTASSASTVSNSITSATDELVLDFVAINGNPASLAVTASNGQTEQLNFIDSGNSIRNGLSTKAGATSVTSGWAIGAGASNIAQVLVAVKAAAGGGGSVVPKILQQARVSELDKQIFQAGLVGAAVSQIKNRRHFLAGLGAVGIHGVTK